MSQARFKSDITRIQVRRLPLQTACLVSAYHLHHSNHHFSELNFKFQIKCWCNRQHILATCHSPVPSQFAYVENAGSSCPLQSCIPKHTCPVLMLLLHKPERAYVSRWTDGLFTNKTILRKPAIFFQYIRDEFTGIIVFHQSNLRSCSGGCKG
jgi:hypothetical protein